MKGCYENDNVKLIKYIKEVVIDTLWIKRYFQKNHTYKTGWDYYGRKVGWGNFVFDGKKEIFSSSKTCTKKGCFIDFISSIKEDKEMQEWYWEKKNALPKWMDCKEEYYSLPEKKLKKIDEDSLNFLVYGIEPEKKIYRLDIEEKINLARNAINKMDMSRFYFIGE